MSSEVPIDGGVPSEGPELLALRRLAFTALPPTIARRRRARLADGLARMALADAGDDYAAARARVIRDVLHAGPGGGWLPAGLVRVVDGGPAASRQIEHALAGMVPASRAAFALMHLENLPAARIEALLASAGVADPRTAVSIATRTPLDPTALRSVVVPVATASVSPRLVGAAAIGLVLAVAAPVIAVSAFSGEDTKPAVQVSNELRTDSERESAIQAAKDALKDARERDGDTADQSLKRILARLDDALDEPGLSRRQKQRLKKLRADVVEERQRLRD